MIYAGIDLGGTTIKGALVTEAGEILCEKSIPTGGERPQREVVQDMANLVLELVEAQGMNIQDIASVGIGSPGAIDPVEGKVMFAANFADFRDVPMVSIMKETLPVPVYLENDANVAALGEAMFGAGNGSANAITITLGTGLGGGIIIDGKIFSGAFYGGGEMGHQVIVADGLPCTCGRKGCWEVYSAATALIRMGREKCVQHPDSKMYEQVKGDLRELNAKHVFDAADAGDVYAKEAIQEYAHYLAIGLGNTINVFQPEYLIIGGGPSAQGDKLLNPVKEELKKEVFGGVTKTQVVIAKLGNKAGVIGAAMLGKTREA
ncbi:MAG: ROK family protein [Lachnospiraceae bacterium]|jgi:glucokinase|nr:ROK family protein [Lachnospiraceae bacterium]